MKRRAAALPVPPHKRMLVPGFAPSLTSAGAVLRLFWTHFCCVPYYKLCTNVLREVASYLPEDRLIPGVYKNKMLIYNAATGLKMAASRPPSIAPYSTFCVLDRTFAVTFQGVPPLTSIVRLDMIRQTTSSFPCTQVSRQRPGLVCHQGVLYAFGGKDNGKNLKSCEKIALGDSVWTQLPDMHRRSQLGSPCQTGSVIYLPARCSLVMEAFNTLTEAFTLLPMSPYHHNITPPAFIASGDMHILVESSVVQRWKVAAESTTPAYIQTMTLRRLRPNCSCEVVVMGREALWLSSTQGVLVRFRLDVGTIRVEGMN